ncbi:MAG: hypothetical protein ACFLMY_08505 [Candidatus Brachytrichaceae bacterium NZ_4S206]|jgi:hypothetical protein
MKFAKRVSLLIPALALALSACGAPAAEVDRNSDFFLALPRIEVALDDNGTPSIAGISPELLNTLTFGQLDLSQFAIGKDWVDYLKSTGVQHIELAFNGKGAYIYANGKQLPSISLSEESVSNIGDVAESVTPIFAPGYEGYAALAKRFLPLARSLGLGLVIRVPSTGAPEIPLRDPKAPPAPAAAPGEDSVQVRIVIDYDQNGVPSVAGISAAELEQMFGLDLTMVKLDANFVRALIDRGVQHISMRSEGDGLALAFNDKPLPNLVCDGSCLKNTSEVIVALNTYPEFSQINTLVEKFGPTLSSVNAEIALRFPPAPGSQRIPLPFGSGN